MEGRRACLLHGGSCNAGDHPQELWAEPSTVCVSSQLQCTNLSASLSPGKMVSERALQTADGCSRTEEMFSFVA